MSDEEATTAPPFDFQDLPLGLEPPPEIGPPNVPIELFSGDLELLPDAGSPPMHLDGSISLHWLPEPQVRFQACDPRNENFRSNVSHGILSARDAPLRVPVMITSRSLPLDGSTQYRGIATGPAIRGCEGDSNEIRFSLINFLDYNGFSIRHGEGPYPGLSNRRLTFSSDEWAVDVDQSPSYQDLLRTLSDQGGFAATHSGRIQRPDGTAITFDEANHLTTALFFFFGFLAGRWCGPVLISGRTEDEEVWSLYSCWMLRQRPLRRSWFPHLRGREVSQTLPGFLQRWNSGLWNRALRIAIHWYVMASSEASFSEAVIASGFVPLEMMTWLIIVDEHQLVSASALDRHSNAQSRLESLLALLGVDIQIPNHLEHLQEAADAHGWISGPQALTRIRNSIVHPTSDSLDRLEGLSSRVRYEVRELSLQYLELILLHAFSYSGTYALRGFSGWKGDDLVPVPWYGSE